MPRDGSGFYTKPAGTTATPNTKIRSAQFNALADDLAAAINEIPVANSIGAAALKDGAIEGKLGFTPASTDDLNAIRTATHPLAGSRQYLKSNGHFWNGPILYHNNLRRFIHFYSRSRKHGRTGSAGLRVSVSSDAWMQDTKDDSIWNFVGYEASPQFGAAYIWPSGRVALYVMIVSFVGDNEWYYIHSDNITNGDAWTVVRVTPPTAGEFVPYGNVIDTPDGPVVYGYGGATPEIRWGDIENEGGVMSFGTACAVSGVALVEPTVVKVDTNKFLMYIRNGSTGGNAYVSVSTDGKTWSTPVDSGINIGRNPIVGFMDGENAYLYGCIRRGYAVDNWENRLLYVLYNANELFDLGGVFPTGSRAWLDGGPMPDRFTGSIFTTRDRTNSLWAVAAAGEELVEEADPEAAQSIILFSPHNRIIPEKSYSPPSKNRFLNPYFRIRSGFTANAALASGQVCDSWFWNGNTATANVQYPDMTAETQELMGGGDEQVSIDSSGAAFSEFYCRFHGKEEVLRWSESPLKVQLEAMGGIPAGSSCQVTFSAGSGGTMGAGYAPTSALWGDTLEAGNSVWINQVEFPAPKADVTTWGTNPYVQVSVVKAGASGGAWSFKPLRAKFNDAPIFDEIERPIMAEEDVVLNTNYEVLSWQADIMITTFMATSGTSGYAGPIFAGYKQKGVACTLKNLADGDLVIIPGRISVTAANVSISASTDGRSAHLSISGLTGLSAGTPYQLWTDVGKSATMVFATLR